MANKPSIAELSLQLTGLFEAEVLIELILRQWNHPLATQSEFREGLLEMASGVLRAAVAGENVFKDMESENISLITAVCLAESTALSTDNSISDTELAERQKWLDAIRRALPSCFCDPDLLA